MKRTLLLSLCAVLLLSGCNTVHEGAYVGGQFGYVIGSAIGGITGGGRGHDIGGLIGVVGGVAAGAAIGAAAEKEHDRKVDERLEERRRNAGQSRQWDDDRVDFGLRGPEEPPLEIRNAVIVESKHDGVLTRGEECQVVFEIYNTSKYSVFGVKPIVADVTENRHVKISPNLLIESIDPGKGIRYTATILADSRLKEGEIKVMVGVSLKQREVSSQTRYFTVRTAKGVR